ncbi:helix-turn-helix domain-containing protein [Actinomadura sp. SCN-SB]|uniref:helix-turn-helix domain-containing protein n=1 Tax=Actinomadura sp. SCN-SB TaxID=3373092 RepID=UPI00375222B7
MPSPYVRRRRLAAELRKIRENRGLTTDELAKLVYQSRTKITRLELGQVRPDLAEVVSILQALGVEGRQYEKLFQLALEAAGKGWWDRYGVAMGPRQKLYADLEANAKGIKNYNLTGMPAILQHPTFISALVDLDRCQGPLNYRPERMTEARELRQRELLRSNGPAYDTILDESVVHRLAVPPTAMAAQLQHMIAVVSSHERITVRVLPHNVRIPGGLLPKSSFFLFTFPDAGDSPLVVLETVTDDLVLDQRGEVAQYTCLYDRLRKAALSPKKSVTFLRGVANRLVEEAGS